MLAVSQAEAHHTLDKVMVVRPGPLKSLERDGPNVIQTLQPRSLGLAYWEGVDQVPAQFLCQKAFDATALHDLGELC